MRGMGAVGTDYRVRRNGRGGSRPGRDVRPAPKALKLAVYRWAVATVGGGAEAAFSRSIEPHRARFTKSVFEDVLEPLWDRLEDECLAYLTGREDRAAKLVSERFHKMYYAYDQKTKGRGEASPEHPRFWSATDRAAAEARLAEVGWPW
jgi:hypothetical protein